MDYGIMEAAAYGFILGWYSDNKNQALCRNIRAAIKHSGGIGNSIKISGKKRIKVQPVLACPRAYYSEQTKGSRTRKCLEAIVQKVNLACRGENRLDLGFWIIPDNVHFRETEGEKHIPELSPNHDPIEMYTSLDALYQALKKKS